MTDLRAALHDHICITVTHDPGIAAAADRQLELGRTWQQVANGGSNDREATSADGLALIGG